MENNGSNKKQLYKILYSVTFMLLETLFLSDFDYTFRSDLCNGPGIYESLMQSKG